MTDTATDKPRPTRFEPPATEANEPFWEASREQRFLVQRCDRCDHPIFYPREVCPTCLQSDQLAWTESEGRGVVHAISVQHKPANPMMADRVPYAVAIVELADGIRLMSNIVVDDPESVAVGDPVQLTWEPLSDGRHLPQFEPAKES
jgi:uncharacterized OB-fold protein